MPHERIDDKIIRTFARIQTPLLEELKIEYGKNKVIDEIREDKALFNYEFYNVFAKTEKLEEDITLKGKIIDKKYAWTIAKDEIINTNVDLEILFAKMEMDRLEDYIRNCVDSDKVQEYKNLIIELSEKYNINSKYTAFLTVYERENKILEAPEYQETTLSNGFAEGIKSKISSMIMEKCMNYMDCESEDIGDLCLYEFKDMEDLCLNCINLDYDDDETNKPTKSTNDCFEDEDFKLLDDEEKCIDNQQTMIQEKTDREKLYDKIKEYYKQFMNQEEKSIITYLLFAIYYEIRHFKIDFDYDSLYQYLLKNKDIVLNNIEIQELLFVLYKQTMLSLFCNIHEFLTEETKKIIETNMKYEVTRKIIEEKDIREILNKNTISEQIDSILWEDIYAYI